MATEDWKKNWGAEIADPIRICPKCVKRGRPGKYAPSGTSHSVLCGICSATEPKESEND